MDVGVRSSGLESHLDSYKLCDSKEVTGHLWASIFFMCEITVLGINRNDDVIYLGKSEAICRG